jgi:hypothetical protein
MVNLEELLDLDPKAVRLPFLSEPAFDSSAFGANISSAPLALDMASDSLAFPDTDLIQDGRWNISSSTMDRAPDGLLGDDIIMVDDDGIILNDDLIAQTGITTPKNRFRGTMGGTVPGSVSPTKFHIII